ncbi:RNA polymerase sigma factor SigJ [soil metagenome]
MDEFELATAFETHRARLRAVGYRLLGSLSDADDAVQESWLRLARNHARADVPEIENLGGWLTTVVARISLNMLRARASHAVTMPDPIVTADVALQPEEQAMLADSVGLALLVVLDTLGPAERIALVLHDSFGVGFDEIAALTGGTVSAARQSASRARRRVQGASVPTPEPDRRRQRAVVDAFFRAANGGDFEGLLAVLHPEVVLRSDFGGRRVPVPSVVRGADAVAGQAAMFSNPDAELRPVLVNGAAGVVVLVAGRPLALMAFTVVDDRVVAVDAIADPERVARIAAAVL